MSVNGTWVFVYGGPTGIGIGVIVISDGKFYGADSGDALYEGTIAEDSQSGELTLDVQIHTPAGTGLVSGASGQDLPVTRHQSFKLPPRFNEGLSVTLPVRPGDVTGFFKQVDDEYSAFARGFGFHPKPIKR